MTDRIAQTVVASALEEVVEPIFDDDSYGYRPGRSAHDALEVCRQRCWQFDWVVGLAVKSFFDSVDHQLLCKAVAHHTDQRWVLLYVQRWVQAPGQQPDGTLVERERGTPQGSALSPVHCTSLAQAEQVREAIADRLCECGLELHPDKTRIVYCKQSGRHGSHEHESFDFLGYTFRPRKAKNARGQFFTRSRPR